MSAEAPAGPTLLGRSVRLRPPARAEFQLLFDWYTDPELVAPFDRFFVDTYDSMEQSIRDAPGDLRSLAPRLVIETAADHHVIGTVGYYLAHPVLTLLDVWYMLGVPAERGKGYGSEAVALLVDHLFATQEIDRVGATCDVENVPSAKLLERLGFAREGTLHSALHHHTRWHDVYIYGVTRSAWRSRAVRG
ncbi:MAG TPA: GNAT family protein [Thermoplasmata archaeon]|nr:GNAT family protein [Thermoplasmata archaeon]